LELGYEAETDEPPGSPVGQAVVAELGRGVEARIGERQVAALEGAGAGDQLAVRGPDAEVFERAGGRELGLEGVDELDVEGISLLLDERGEGAGLGQEVAFDLAAQELLDGERGAEPGETDADQAAGEQGDGERAADRAQVSRPR